MTHWDEWSGEGGRNQHSIEMSKKAPVLGVGIHRTVRQCSKTEKLQKHKQTYQHNTDTHTQTHTYAAHTKEHAQFRGGNVLSLCRSFSRSAKRKQQKRMCFCCFRCCSFVIYAMYVFRIRTLHSFVALSCSLSSTSFFLSRALSLSISLSLSTVLNI